MTAKRMATSNPPLKTIRFETSVSSNRDDIILEFWERYFNNGKNIKHVFELVFSNMRTKIYFNESLSIDVNIYFPFIGKNKFVKEEISFNL